MGLTAHNRKRREMAAKGQTGEVVKATAHRDAAARNVAHLRQALTSAESHLARCEDELTSALAAAPTPEPEPAPEPEPDGPDYAAMKYSELQIECKLAGLSAKGKKADLVARLEAGG